ncbi:MAG: flagellar type III secretion system pore protein FliP [Proteobacteria bacterium]|nr:flagellar type III secretion system pore protein FliP [Pseudomonadota bacterium]
MLKLLARLLPVLLLVLLVPLAAHAQVPDVNINLNDDLLSSRRIFQMFIVLTVLSLAPSILMMVTSFTRIVIVFSFLRTAMGLQNTPPNTVIISLSLFLTLFVMSPTLEEAYKSGVAPYLNEEISEEAAIKASIKPFHTFMIRHVDQKDLGLFVNMLPDAPKTYENEADVPLRALIPAFMISEIKRAFEIGFLIFLPFVVIDLAIASILMSMGMMMLPPVIISLPFKIIFFVLVDGWHLLSGSLVESFNVPT